MKVWELIAELSKYPAGYDIEVEMVEEDYTVNTIKEKGSPQISAVSADLESIESYSAGEKITLTGSFQY
jgi:hypothetical protein